MSGFTCWAKGKKPPPTPSPAEYTLPDVFGTGPKYSLRGRFKERNNQPCPTMYKGASTLSKKSCSFGFRPHEQKYVQTPEPLDISKPFGSDCRKCSIGVRVEDQPNTNPGPAEYTISREFVSVKHSILTGKRSEVINKDMIGDPGSILIPSQFEHPPGITLGPSIPLPEPERNGPGPKYDQKTLIGTDSPHYTLSISSRDVKIPNSPGPADYQRIRPLTSESQLGCKIKNRTTLPHPDICDYPYHAYPGCISPRKFYHGIRPETNYETPGPGPIYINTKPPKENRKTTIGKKIKIRNPLEDNPSPDQYFTVPITPAPKPFPSFKGPDVDERGLLSKEKTQIPGPGYYDQPSTPFERPRTGYYFTSRAMDQFIADTAAPYYPAISTLGGPKFTIGKKDPDN